MRLSQFVISGLLFVSSSVFAQVPQYAGCAEEDYVTITEPEVIVQFQGSSYEPACIKIKRGTKVTIPASQKHPLQGSADFEGVANPLRSPESAFFTNQTITPDTGGFLGYYCTRHGDATSGSGMGGMIWVVE
jgi:plastocyanin